MSSDSESVEFVQYLIELFHDVEADANTRHMEGADKYGPLKFLTADTLQEAYEEILDLMNYARYTAVKVKLLQVALAEKASGLEQEGFVSTSEFLKKGFKPE
jgi:hypothetical protein